jgi:DEAD/DEAH box helicase domain-containing protein
MMRNAYYSANPVLLPPYRSTFEPPVTSDRGDPLQCVPPLKHARATLERRLCSTTNALHAEEFCYWPALALGRCRLFGVNVGDESDFTLAPEPFSLASSWLLKRLRGLIRWARDIDQLRNRGGAYVDQNLALELLEIRMDAHAAYIALDEAYAAARFTGEVEADAMGRRLHQVRRLIDRLDGNLQNQIPLLRLAASTRLLENWRRLLAPAYRDCPPWWLDGCLEN